MSDFDVLVLGTGAAFQLQNVSRFEYADLLCWLPFSQEYCAIAVKSGTLGPGMVFGFRAGRSAAERLRETS